MEFKKGKVEQEVCKCLYIDLKNYPESYNLKDYTFCTQCGQIWKIENHEFIRIPMEDIVETV